MTAMARSGRGNAYYGRTADDLMDPFREEFDRLNVANDGDHGKGHPGPGAGYGH